jgi:FAM91 N-terminus
VICSLDRRRVKGYCHQRGLRWGDSLAKTVCGEQEYYEDLIRFYRSSLRVRWGHMGHSDVCQCSARVVSTLPLYGSLTICPHLLLFAQLFPYHLASYVCQVLRTTPFKYYCDLLFSVMREERSYDFIPNFTVGRCAGLHL